MSINDSLNASDEAAATGEDNSAELDTAIENDQESATDENDESGQDSTATSDKDSEDDGTDDEDTVPKKKTGFQRRIEKAKTKAREEANAEIEYWRNVALGKTDEPSRTSQKQEAREPVFSDYNDIELFTKATALWTAEKLFAEMQENSKAENYHKTVHDKYVSKVSDFKKEHKDFDSVIADANDVDVPLDIQSAILESDIGPAVTYFFGKNVDELERIIALSPTRRLIEFGKIEAMLSPKDAKKAVSISKAPTPIKPLNASKGKTGAVNLHTDAANMSYKDFEKARREQLAAKRK